MLWTAALVLTALFGSLHGATVYARAEIEEDVDAAIRTFTHLLSLLEENSATAVNSEVAVYGAIDGMLRTLDPHSTFIRPEDAAARRQDLQGKYYGLGIRVAARFGKVTIVEPPFFGSPAEKVGLKVGDVFSHVNGEAIEGWNLNDVVNRLKGPKGTPVDATIARPGVEEPLQMTIIRGEIASFSISNKFVMDNGIGYIKLTTFAETSGTELHDALRELDAQNLQGLILDLRANPGGALQAAIDVAETFLQRDELIVETRGRARGSNREFPSQRINNDNLFPLVVLIDRNSASASEIVAGAIQDHDRGLIVGETSFGKGLVQSLLPLSKQAILTLTTQKWYTPSGRLIQRDYEGVSQFDYYNNRVTEEDGSTPDQDDTYSSDLGRILYGGGGITPDDLVSRTDANEFQRLMASRYTFFTFVQEFLEDNPPIDASFEATDEMIEEYAAHVRDRGIEFSDDGLAANVDYLKGEIQYEVLYNRLGVSEADRVRLQTDPQFLTALELIPDARDLSLRARAATNSPE
jgi:carboxyl-terminal processing protease